MADLYAYPYNYSENLSINGIGDYFIYISSIVSDHFAAGFILIIWLFSFGVGTLLGAKKSIILASFISFVFSIYFLKLGILNPVITIGLLILTILGAVLSSLEGKI